MPTHSRQIVRTAAMITGPTKSPISPNVRRPPKIPISASRKGNRVVPLRDTANGSLRSFVCE